MSIDSRYWFDAAKQLFCFDDNVVAVVLKIRLCMVQSVCLKFLNQVCKPRSIISPLLQTFCLISAHILDLILNQYFSPWSYSLYFLTLNTDLSLDKCLYS